MVNNATRFAVDNEVRINLSIVETDKPTNVLITVENTIEPQQEQILLSKFGENCSALFDGGFTTGGTGIGLSICTELIANAYGIKDKKLCLTEKYLGAYVVDRKFISWFHWPIKI
jgi:signal transduction histidine kinase